MAGGPGRTRQARGRAGGANEEIKRHRLDLPWIRVEKEYEFDSEEGRKTLADLFNGRSQLLAYNIMFAPGYTLGACPGCTSLADGLDGTLVHLSHRDVTLLCFSRAPIERLTAYKRRMGWQFPYVSTCHTDFAFDFGLALKTARFSAGGKTMVNAAVARCSQKEDGRASESNGKRVLRTPFRSDPSGMACSGYPRRG